MKKHIVITGVSRGLGLALVNTFVRQGHRLAGVASTSAAIEELRRTCGPEHLFGQVDVVNDGAVAGWAEEVLRRCGPPDLLINNAAIINRNAPLWTVPAQEFDRVMDVNIKGVANVIRHFVPAMVAARKGVIVNFSSGWGRSTEAEVAPYCATKWAIEGLTRALAQELPAGMAAIPLNPGIIDTDMLRSCFGHGAAAFPSAAEWAEKAAPFILNLGPRENGQPLFVP